MKNPPTCFRASMKLPHFNIDPMDNISDEAILQDKPTTSTHSKKLHKDYNVVHCISQCQECNSIKMNSSELLDITSLKNMSDIQREFLQLHEKNGHPSFDSMLKQAKAGILPRKFTTMKPKDFPVCISCKLGKATKLRQSEGSII